MKSLNQFLWDSENSNDEDLKNKHNSENSQMMNHMCEKPMICCCGGGGGPWTPSSFAGMIGCK